MLYYWRIILNSLTKRCLKTILLRLRIIHTCVRLAFWDEISNRLSVECESYMYELPDHLFVSTFFGAPIEIFNCNVCYSCMEIYAKLWGIDCLEFFYVH